MSPTCLSVHRRCHSEKIAIVEIWTLCTNLSSKYHGWIYPGYFDLLQNI